MSILQLSIEILLILLLAGTLSHAIRLERGRASIKQDRAELERLIQSFDESNQQAEAGAERLRIAADAAGRSMNRQVEGASNLRDELAELIERGERLAGRLGSPVRNGLEPAAPRMAAEPEFASGEVPRVRSPAERDLLRALRVTR